MTINTNYEPESYISNGVLVDYDFDFPAFDETDLRVYVKDTSDNVVLQTLNSDYTVALNDDKTGTITFDTAPTLDYTIYIRRKTAQTQSTAYKTSSGFQALVVENDFDKAVAISQELSETVERQLYNSPFSDATVNAELPIPSDTKCLKWDYDSGTDTYSLVNSTYDPDEYTAEAEAQAVIATTQAGIATAAATEAEGYRDEAEGYRDEAEVFRDEAEAATFKLVEIGACSTAGATAAKTATLTNFSLVDGMTFKITFTNQNTNADPTLNINSTGDIAIADENGNVASSTSPFYVKAGTTIEFTYDGTNFVYANKIVKSYISGTTWYKIWSDGWVEQSGVKTVASDSSDTATLSIAHIDTNYSCFGCHRNTLGISTDAGIGIWPSSTSVINITNAYGSSSDITWKTEGY